MGSVIVELQREALDKDVRVADLLRKALVVARKLKLKELQVWIEKELNGYDIEVPDYRMTTGQIKRWHSYDGWMPLIFKHPQMGETLSKRGNNQSIAEIEALANNLDAESTLIMPLPQETQRELCKGLGFETEVVMFCSDAALVRILDAVRNIILNWALQLEEEGVLGEGLTFSEKEKSVAGHSPQNITNYYGPVQNSQIAQGNQQAIQVASTFQLDKPVISKFIEDLSKALPTIELNSESAAEINADIATIKTQLDSPKPKKSIVKESLISIRNIMEGAGGSVAGQLFLDLGKFLIVNS